MNPCGLHRFGGPEKDDLSADNADDADSEGSTDSTDSGGRKKDDLSADNADDADSEGSTDYTDSVEGQNLDCSPTDSLRGIAQKGPESHASFGPICAIRAICG